MATIKIALESDSKIISIPSNKKGADSSMMSTESASRETNTKTMSTTNDTVGEEDEIETSQMTEAEVCYGDAEDAEFEDCELDEKGWDDDDTELVFDEQKTMEIHDTESMRRDRESVRRAKERLDAFWKCGGCQFLLSFYVHSAHSANAYNLYCDDVAFRNHPSRTMCMVCHISRCDEIHSVCSLFCFE